MREFGTYIRDELVAGLIPDLSAPKGARALTKATGFVPRSLALQVEPATVGLSDWADGSIVPSNVNHFIDLDGLLLAVVENISVPGTYRLIQVESDELINLAPPIEDFNDSQETMSINVEARFRGIEAQGSILLVNGKQLLFYDQPEDTWKGVIGSVIPASVVIWNERLVFGAFQHEDAQGYWSGEEWWEPIWAEAKLAMPSIVVDKFVQDDSGVDGRYLLIGPPGSARDSVFLLELMMLYGEGDMQQMIIEQIRNRMLKVLRVPWDGPVLEMKTISNRVALYGEKNIGFLAQTEQGLIVMQKIRGIGIKNRDSIAGDRQRHIFISSNHKLFELTGEYQLSDLGFEHLIEELEA